MRNGKLQFDTCTWTLFHGARWKRNGKSSHWYSVPVDYERFFDETLILQTRVCTCLCLRSGLGSICFASVAALYQKRLKRLMAYSSVSHTGFLLLGICCQTVESIKACSVYIVLYILMSLSLFSVLFLSGINNTQQKYLISWTSLFERNFGIAIAFALILFSIAGIPPLAGFYSKLCIFLCLLAKDHISITIIITIFSSIGCYYYIRLIKILFFNSDYKNNFWFGAGTKNVESFISLSVTIILLFLARPNIFTECATITALSLT
jgi:NADH-quinone oxidoreductase subunit N